MSVWLCARKGVTRTCARDDLSSMLFHSSAPVSKKKYWHTGRARPDSNTSSPSGSIDAEPRQPKKNDQGKAKTPPPPAFERDPLPHAGVVEAAPPSNRDRNPSFRRRSQARNEQDWSRRTGRWNPEADLRKRLPHPDAASPPGRASASNFGGGARGGSQMGLREDRPASYGLSSGRPDSGSLPQDQRAEERVPRRSYAPHPVRNYRDEHGQPPPDFPMRSSRPPQRPPQKPRFGLLPDDDHRTSSRSPPLADQYPPGRTQRPGFDRRPDEDKRASSSRSSPSTDRYAIDAGEWSQPREEPFSDDSSSDNIGDSEPVIPKLKNRNQPAVPPASPPPPATKTKADTPSPPRKSPLPDISPFYHAPPNLTRAGVPIIAKSDTASFSAAFQNPTTHRMELPTKFTSPPLLPGLVKCLSDVLGGPTATPTLIQALSLKWVVEPWSTAQENAPSSTESESESAETAVVPLNTGGYKEFLLASETGSGKSIAYLLPVLQALKLSEVRRATEGGAPVITSKRGLNPRALILAPTHELARQLSGFAKALLHDVKLRVLCASRANEPVRVARDKTAAGKGKKNSSASRMKALLSFAEDGKMGEFEVKEAEFNGSSFPVDVVVGTPMKIMEMVRGRGWERSVEFGGGVTSAMKRETAEKNDDLADEDGENAERGPKRRRGRDSLPGVGKWKSSPELGLAAVEWVVVDEADVLFDPDFQETTRMLLADIAKARGHPVPFTALPVGLLAPAPPTVALGLSASQKEQDKKAQEQQTKSIVKANAAHGIKPLNYPFNFLLASATIPKSLSTYLNAYHPALQRLVSPNVHHLPKTVRPEYVNWTGGNKNADIERRLRKVWAADAASGLGPAMDSLGDMSKVLIFCNRNTKVNDLGEFLDERGIKNVQLSGSSENRKRGSNKHLTGFLKTSDPPSHDRPNDWSSSWVAEEQEGVEEETVEVPEEKRKNRRSLKPTAREAEEPAPLNDPMHVPHVMITTSLLSRGLDFSPNIKHVFIIDEPRNMIDFLHRAGRTGRAGEHGRVVIFGKMEGRGSQRSKAVRTRVKTLLS